MAIKTVLVPVDTSPESLDALIVALVVSKRFGAHLEAIHVVHSSLEAISHMSDRMPASLRKSVAEQAKNDAREHADAAKAKFEEFCKDHDVQISNNPGQDQGVTAEWLEVSGEVANMLVRRGRLSDVIVVSRPTEHLSKIRRSPAGENLEAVMMETGRPLLIVPPGETGAPAKHIAIGWNESQEAARALSSAIPWMVQMDQVTVIVSKKRESRVNEVVEYLSWHGVTPRVQLLDNKGNVGVSILETCSSAGADLLVVGGFSHSRARELLFGGVTRHLLSESSIPTLMVH